MTQAKLNIFVRVITRRMEQGESLDEILAGYSNLTKAEKKEIKQAIEG